VGKGSIVGTHGLGARLGGRSQSEKEKIVGIRKIPSQHCIVKLVAQCNRLLFLGKEALGLEYNPSKKKLDMVLLFSMGSWV
jgi:hypothetical protein